MYRRGEMLSEVSVQGKGFDFKAENNKKIKKPMSSIHNNNYLFICLSVFFSCHLIADSLRKFFRFSLSEEAENDLVSASSCFFHDFL